MASHSLFHVLTLEPLALGSTPLIDVRPAADFAAGHPMFSTNIPLEIIETCWHELPPKGASLDLLANKSQQHNLRQIFERQDYQINSIILAEEEEQAKWSAGSRSQRLWRANPLLEQYINLIKKLINSDNPLAFDVGAGSGRDSVFLSLHGFKTIAFDNNQHALNRLQQFSERTNSEVETLNINLQLEIEKLKLLITTHNPQFIMQARYLHRPLLDIYRDYLPCGAMVAIHTFTQEAAMFGKPKNPAYLLQTNELTDKFSGWKILLDQAHTLEDGRPLTMFLAQKP